MTSSEKTFPISGIPADVHFKTKDIPYAPGLPSRREISELFPSDDPLTRKQWTLFVLALNGFKALGVENKLSYFQVAGIHSYPLQSWDGAVDPPKPGGRQDGGYCQHNTIKFPTWHRPYMLLFEKLVWTHMNDVIDAWKLDSLRQTEWKKAADTWRLPYWDWARKQSYDQEYSLPAVLMVDQVTIYPPDKPEGQTGVTNPLWGFANPETVDGKPDGKPRPFGDMPKGKTKWAIPDNGKLPWSKCSAISRFGIFSEDGESFTGLDGFNNFTEANLTLNQFSKNWYNPFKDQEKFKFAPPGTLSDAVNRMFSSKYTDTWDTFASTKWWEKSAQEISTGYLSLEYIHNNVHNLTGGSNYKKPEKGEIGGYGLGHMSDVPVAAFDPVFWLHHCNIDRLLAMWQALNWEAWFDTPAFLDNDASKPNPALYADLLPFHAIETDKPETGYWTSDGVRDWTELHYSYDDLKPRPEAILPDGTLDEGRYKTDLLAHIQDIYPSTQKYYEKLFHDSSIKNEDFFGPHNTENVTWNDYIINVTYDRYALNGTSYVIQFWLGGEDNKPDTTFKDQENLIGQVYSFGGLTPASADAPGGCANCGEQKDNKVLSRAQVPLTIPIISQALDRGYQHIDSTRGRHVEPYLMKHLHWKFVQIGGEEKPASDFPNTTISVWRGTGKAQEPVEETGEALPPVYAGYQILYKPTDGKDCGLTHDDELLGEANKPHFHFRTF
ncbi:hypothetical protein B0J13DRAFT_622059 [Dactylonectria estremocensis]|uniref:tyrosinase n=1 Tax=Dactylonectria estremocensis TaxID=1079267 RepID=A0A9P9J9F7_9HYPO|nr:hypothetical protein B0J13DRAFT_622059 [Dactylonectria estremocensis]